MAINVNNFKSPTSNDFGTPSCGTHVARFIGVVDLGIQDRPAFKGAAKAPCQKLNLSFELTNDFIEMDGVKRPRWISKTENAFSDPKSNLAAIIAALDPTNAYKGDIGAMARDTIPCLVTIVQKTDANGNLIDGVRISQVSPTIAGLPVPPAANPPLIFDMDAPDLAAYTRLPKWVKDTIGKAHNFNASPVVQIAQLFAQAQAPAQAPTNPVAAVSTPTPVLGSPQVHNVAPVAPQAVPAVQTTQSLPPAPPGFVYDPATNSFKPAALGGATAVVNANVPSGQPY